MRLVFAHIAVTAAFAIAATAALLTLSAPVLAETGPDPVPESRDCQCHTRRRHRRQDRRVRPREEPGRLRQRAGRNRDRGGTMRTLIVAAVFALLSGLGLIVAETAKADQPGPPPPPPPPAWDCMLPWANPLPRCAGAPPLPCDRVHGGQGIPGIC
jgi:hypothetical protein